MTKSATLLGIIIFFITSIIFVPVAHAEKTVYISELNYNGSSINGGDKWVELYNPTPSSIDLTGWKLIMPNSSKTGLVNLSGVISSNSTFIVSVKNTNFTSILPTKPDLLNYNITNISNTQTDESNYINVELVSNLGIVVSRIQQNDTQVKNFGVSTKGSVKRSIECDSLGFCKVAENEYGTTGKDYGTPGIVVLPSIINEPQKNENVIAVPEITYPQPIIKASKPIVNQIQLTEAEKVNSTHSVSNEIQQTEAKIIINDVDTEVLDLVPQVPQNFKSTSFIFSSPSISTIVLPTIKFGNIAPTKNTNTLKTNISTDAQLFLLVILSVRAMPIILKKKVVV